MNTNVGAKRKVNPSKKGKEISKAKRAQFVACARDLKAASNGSKARFMKTFGAWKDASVDPDDLIAEIKSRR